MFFLYLPRRKEIQMQMQKINQHVLIESGLVVVGQSCNPATRAEG